MMLTSIEDAVNQGARRAVVCRHLGISARAAERWKKQPADARRGPVTAPANKLSEVERQLVVSVANSAEFRDVSPKQIVPRAWPIKACTSAASRPSTGC